MLTPPKANTLLIITRTKNFPSFIGFSGLSYKNTPCISPVKAALSVNPGKYEPNGNSNAPIKSPNAAIIVLYLGPK